MSGASGREGNGECMFAVEDGDGYREQAKSSGPRQPRDMRPAIIAAALVGWTITMGALVRACEASHNYNDGWSDAASCTYSPRHGIAPYCELVNE